MMAKMFYTLEETKAALQKNEEEIKQLAREGRLREFRDGPRLMFKADQVESIKNELGLGGESADPSAQTNIASNVPDQVSLESVGSGSGLLDLTRESDDTSLGAELLDEIAPGAGSKAGSRGPGGSTATGAMAGTRAGTAI